MSREFGAEFLELPSFCSFSRYSRIDIDTRYERYYALNVVIGPSSTLFTSTFTLVTAKGKIAVIVSTTAALRCKYNIYKRLTIDSSLPRSTAHICLTR